MKLLGLITEYNPFHNGHLYHLNKAKEITNADGVVCIMNGNFMQRGKASILNKWSRTEMALENGIDIVIELPFIFGIRSAEYFASASIQLLSSLDIDYFVFGSESGDIKSLKSTAEILIKESSYFKKRLKIYLKNGNSFPEAREKAIVDYLDSDNNYKIKDTIKDIVNKPNNILGIEYLKAIIKQKSKLKSFTIKRSGAEYHSDKINKKIASATAIRKLINENKLEKVKNLIPEESFNILIKELKNNLLPIQEEILGNFILTRLRQLTINNLQDYLEINEDLARRINNASYISGNYEELFENISTRLFTNTRIQRNLLYILFDLKKKSIKKLDRLGPLYARVLGFKSQSQDILSYLNKKSKIEIITQVANYLKSPDINHNNPLIQELSYDLIATDIYSLLYPSVENRKGKKDYYRPLLKVD